MLDLPVSFLGWYNLFKDYLQRGIFMKRLAKRMTAVFLSLCLLLAGLCAAPTVPAKAAADEGWVGAWSTSPWNLI